MATPSETPYGGTLPPITTPTTVTETTATVSESPQPDNGLAFTGGDLAGTVALGGLALAVGTLLTVASRRRRLAPLA